MKIKCAQKGCAQMPRQEVDLNCVILALIPRILFIVCTGLEADLQDLKAKLEPQSLWSEDPRGTQRGP